MKAIVQDRYGPLNDVVELAEIEKPATGDDEVLVQVRAASLHVGDWIVMKGEPLIMRPMFGVRRPKLGVLGTDLAGQVESVGKDVTRFKAGDEVFGWCEGAFAEYASAAEDHFVPKPANLTFEQAAAVGVSAFAALHGLRDQGKVQTGQKVLINGASGGVGTYAVQIAKSFGAEVTGVASTRNVDMLRSIGADHVIDYTEEDFTSGEKRYDFIFDNVGNRSPSEMRRILTPDGSLQPNGGGHSSGRWFGPLGSVIKSAVSSIFIGQQGSPYLSKSNSDDLVVLKELVESGKVTPVIDRTYPLMDTAEAIAHVGDGHAQGTTVITM